MKEEDLEEQRIMGFVALTRLETSAPHHRVSVFGLFENHGVLWEEKWLVDGYRKVILG